METKMNEQALRTILFTLTTEELLAQLAEECAELSQAALKLIRARTGRNPTPRTAQECVESLAEEMADVALCMGLVADAYDLDVDEIEEIRDEKVARWAKRLEATP